MEFESSEDYFYYLKYLKYKKKYLELLSGGSSNYTLYFFKQEHLPNIDLQSGITKDKIEKIINHSKEKHFNIELKEEKNKFYFTDIKNKNNNKYIVANLDKEMLKNKNFESFYKVHNKKLYIILISINLNNEKYVQKDDLCNIINKITKLTTNTICDCNIDDVCAKTCDNIIKSVDSFVLIKNDKLLHENNLICINNKLTNFSQFIQTLKETSKETSKEKQQMKQEDELCIKNREYYDTIPKDITLDNCKKIIGNFPYKTAVYIDTKNIKLNEINNEKCLSSFQKDLIKAKINKCDKIIPDVPYGKLDQPNITIGPQGTKQLFKRLNLNAPPGTANKNIKTPEHPIDITACNNFEKEYIDLYNKYTSGQLNNSDMRCEKIKNVEKNIDLIKNKNCGKKNSDRINWIQKEDEKCKEIAKNEW